VSRQLTAVGGAALAPIRAAFGPNAIAPDGAMDRAFMREKVFSDPSSKAKLEGILHPLIREQMQASRQAAQDSASPYVLVDSPLLLESSSWQQSIDKVIVVDCSEAMQIERVKTRSGLPETQIKAQISRPARLARADYILDNQGSLEQLLAQVTQLHASLMKMVCYPSALRG
jgi:dephospho-CoA kinase